MLCRVSGQAEGHGGVRRGKEGALSGFQDQAVRSRGEGHRAAHGNDYGRTVLRHRHRGGILARALGQFHALQLEFLEGRPVQLLARVRVFGGECGNAQRAEVDGAQQFRHVDVLGGEPAAQDVVRSRHDLHAQPAQVGMDVARRKVDGVAGLQ